MTEDDVLPAAFIRASDLPGKVTLLRETIPRPSERDDWLALRRPYIGASEAAALVDEHPFLTSGELAVEKMMGATRVENRAMRRGTFLEAAVAEWWAADNNLVLTEPTDLYVYGDTLIATLDRRIGLRDEAVEIKTASYRVTEPARYWYWQVQVQMLCARLDRVHIVVLDPSMDLQTFTVEPCPEDQARIFEAAKEFLAHTSEGRLPPDVDLDYRAASTLFPAPTIESVDLNDETARWCRVLASLQSRLRRLQDDENRLKAMIARRLGEAAEGRYQGDTIVTWRQTTRTDVDGKRLRAEHPDLAKEFARSTSYRQLRLKGVKGA